MNKTKRFCAIALAAMMAVTAFAGCGPAATTDTGTTASTATGGDTTTPADDGTGDPLGGEGAAGPISLKVWGPDAAQDLHALVPVIRRSVRLFEDRRVQMKEEREIRIPVDVFFVAYPCHFSPRESNIVIIKSKIEYFLFSRFSIQ